MNTMKILLSIRIGPKYDHLITLWNMRAQRLLAEYVSSLKAAVTCEIIQLDHYLLSLHLETKICISLLTQMAACTGLC